MRKRGLIYGVGVNDLSDNESLCSGVPLSKSRSYIAWSAMIFRCYSDHNLKKHPTYKDCYVCDEWLTFSNFRKWHLTFENIDSFQLDKDIVKVGNKVYCPEFCAMVSPKTNSFVRDGGKNRGKFLIGVHFEAESSRFVSQIRNPFNGKKQKIGRYTTEIEAHLAWRKRKHELACQLADIQSDDRVASALRVRYLPYTEEELQNCIDNLVEMW